MSAAAEPRTSTVDAVDRLPATSLAALTENAALMTRTDRKYVVPIVALPALTTALQSLEPSLKVLEIDGRRRHRYDSTYFDTPGLEAYWRTARRRRHRFKVRTRHYVDTDLAFTEVKTRGPRGSTVKARVARDTGPGSPAKTPLPTAHGAFVATELARAGLAHVDIEGLVPTLRTSYLRSTLWLPSGGARVTLDVDLAWSLPGDHTVGSVPGLAVVETKTAGAGTGVDRALWSQGHRPVRISKYATGLAIMLPDLPAHRWHRVRTRHLQQHLTYTQTQESA